MSELRLFIDGSVNIKSKIGYGAYIAFSDEKLAVKSSVAGVRIKRFENTSSTKLELQTLLWALSELLPIESKIIIYTDSQNIFNLPGRRERLEKNNYCSRQNTLIKNHQLYQEFYRITDQLDYAIVKVSGHKKSKEKDDIDKIFTLVDRRARNAMRSDNA